MVCNIVYLSFQLNSSSERCLENDEKPFELVKQWDKAGEKGSILLFKKKIFINDASDNDKEMEDPIALDLIYQQAGEIIDLSRLLT